MASKTDKLDRHMDQKYGAMIVWDSGDVRCYRSEAQQYFAELKVGTWAIYTFHEEVEESR
jgi:hypothetical protein